MIVVDPNILWDHEIFLNSAAFNESDTETIGAADGDKFAVSGLAVPAVWNATTIKLKKLIFKTGAISNALMTIEVRAESVNTTTGAPNGIIATGASKQFTTLDDDNTRFEQTLTTAPTMTPGGLWAIVWEMIDRNGVSTWTINQFADDRFTNYPPHFTDIAGGGWVEHADAHMKLMFVPVWEIDGREIIMPGRGCAPPQGTAGGVAIGNNESWNSTDTNIYKGTRFSVETPRVLVAMRVMLTDLGDTNVGARAHLFDADGKTILSSSATIGNWFEAEDHQYYYFYFDSPQLLTPGRDYYAVLESTGTADLNLKAPGMTDTDGAVWAYGRSGLCSGPASPTGPSSWTIQNDRWPVIGLGFAGFDDGKRNPRTRPLHSPQIAG